MAQLLDRLAVYVDQKIPQYNAGMDSASNPVRFGGVWTPWKGDPNPANCAAPPLPPVLHHFTLVWCFSWDSVGNI